MKAILLVTRRLRRRTPARASSETGPRRAITLAAHSASLAALLLWSLTGTAHAQSMVTDSGSPAASFMSPVSMPGLQPFWVGYVGADRGLGFQGQYFSAGGLVPITTDMLDGTWFVDGRAHATVNYGNFFSNIGIGRRAYIGNDTILGFSGWYDYDGDAYQNYGYRYNQLGATGEIFNPISDFRVNAYFPVGQTAHVLNEFTQNYLLYQNGIDTAMHGADMKFSVRPPVMGLWNGYLDIGGYMYRSSVTSQVGGISSGFGVSPIPGVAINLEVNHDNLFGTTGFIRVAFGLRGTPGNSRVGNRLLEPTRRNDHIVRFNQQPEIATNPQTGLAYNVIHVDNTAAPGGNGTAENPFRTLADAQAHSATYDMIYVHRGDGTAQGYNSGIVLKDNQMLFGSGNGYLVQTTEVGGFMMHALDSTGPVITNPAGAAVTLANNDRVGGMTISGAQYGIVGNSITNMSMESNRIINSGVDGVLLTSFSGLAHIRNNTLTDNLEDGIHIFGGLGAYDVRGNTVEGNIRNGVFFDGAQGEAVVDSNTLGLNGRGNWGGLHVVTDSGNFTVEASDNLVQGNTEGIILEAINPGAVLTAMIHDNRAIQYNGGDGIEIASRDGSTVNFAVTNNGNINNNGIGTGGGAAIRLYTQDAIMSGTISNNVLYNNAGAESVVNGVLIADMGAGIHGQFDGDSITGFNIVGNVIDGNNLQTGIPQGSPYGDGIRLLYQATDTAVQLLNLTDNQIINSRGGQGVFLYGNSTSTIDATLTHNTIANNFHDGLGVRALDSALIRVTAVNNTITGNVSPSAVAVGTFLEDGGVSMSSEGGSLGGIVQYSRIIGVFENNVIDNNGTFRNSGNINVSGIAGTTTGTGVMALQIFGNQINGNANNGVRLTSNNQTDVTSQFPGSLVAEIRDNMIDDNKGDAAVHALLTLETPPNLSVIGVEITHNQSNKPYIFDNTETAQPPLPSTLGSIGVEDGGLNNAFFYLNGLKTAFVPQGTIAAAISPMLVFP